LQTLWTEAEFPENRQTKSDINEECACSSASCAALSASRARRKGRKFQEKFAAEHGLTASPSGVLKRVRSARGFRRAQELRRR
jgi:hypothetical protein